MFYLGIDLGTSSIKALLADEAGRVLDSESEGYPLLLPRENWSEQEPEAWWEGFCKIMKRLGGRHDLRKVEAMSFSGQMHGLVLLDGEDKVIRPAILWNDGRTSEECEYLNGLDVVGWTGNLALTGFTAPKLLWVKKHEPENFLRIARIMLPKDYLAYRLTGVFASDVSDSSGTLYFNVREKRWSEPMLEILGITKKQLPEVYESIDDIGPLKKEAVALLGMSEKTRVVIGGGDQAMGAIGTGTIKDGQVSISLGTSGVIFINSDRFTGDDKASLHAFCHASGGYHLMGVTLCCAGSLKWWIEDILHGGGSEPEEAGGSVEHTGELYKAAFAGLDKLPSNNLVFLPYLMGERSPVNDPAAKGVFYGLNLGHDRKTITKAVVEGICLSLKDCLKTANACGIHPEYARVIGGGAKSKEWLQILANVLNLELRTINTTEGGGLGAIILAMTACGRFSSIEEACGRLIEERDIFLPDSTRAEEYEQKYKVYKKLYLRLKGVADQ